MNVVGIISAEKLSLNATGGATDGNVVLLPVNPDYNRHKLYVFCGGTLAGGGGLLLVFNVRLIRNGIQRAVFQEIVTTANPTDSSYCQMHPQGGSPRRDSIFLAPAKRIHYLEPTGIVIQPHDYRGSLDQIWVTLDQAANVNSYRFWVGLKSYQDHGQTISGS